MTVHNLKIQRQPFEDLVSGRKTGEVRNCADREFREGDQVELFLIDETGNPANKSIVRTITHIQRGFGLPDDICVLSYAAPVVEAATCGHCNASTTDICNQNGCGYLESGNGAPVVERQEPVGEVTGIEDGAVCVGLYGDPLNIGTLVFTSPPAPVAVVLPERLPTDGNPDQSPDFDEGWNACLDKVKELNQ